MHYNVDGAILLYRYGVGRIFDNRELSRKFEIKVTVINRSNYIYIYELPPQHYRPTTTILAFYQ